MLSNVSHSVDTDRIQKMMDSKIPVKVKFGIDPTGTDLHLGHIVVIRKLQELQNLGCDITIIIGDLTARIGDPSGRDSSRPILSEEQTKKNADVLLNQISKILDTNKCTIIFNSQLTPSFESIFDLLQKVTIQSMLSRDHFKNRFASNDSISILEMICPVLQANDSIQIQCDMEIGGNDQLSNCHLGRELMEKVGLTPQAILLMPILTGIDGHRKMSKTFDNHVSLNHSPTDMFGRIMSIPDSIMSDWFSMLLGKEMDGSVHPMINKKFLAKSIVEIFHGTEKSNNALKEFENVFCKREIPECQTDFIVTQSKNIINILVDSFMVSSKSEAKRNILAGSIRFNGIKIHSIDMEIVNEGILQLGKRKSKRIIFKK